ncbi:uncharacterized protein TNCV_4991051 [Trichonephila clavipes]|nr:uncharacterized protein TNCV_4991051 [Trichonephila clavipes]
MLSSRPGAIYEQDNARPHTARLSQQCLQGYDVLPWPARSPDLSPIEHVCDALGRQLQPSRDTGELTAQMQRLWQDLPQGVISDLFESMPRRISACIAARGGFTTYWFLTFFASLMCFLVLTPVTSYLEYPGMEESSRIPELQDQINQVLYVFESKRGDPEGHRRVGAVYKEARFADWTIFILKNAFWLL